MRRSTTSSAVSSRVVRRWFWNGKGFPTRTAAFRSKAKAEMLEMVLGPWEEVFVSHPNDPDQVSYERLANGYPPTPEGAPEHWQPTEEERREWIDARFGLFFPHDGETGCKTVPRGSIPYNKTCYRLDEMVSCKWAQEQWIRNRMAELIASEGA